MKPSVDSTEFYIRRLTELLRRSSGAPAQRMDNQYLVFSREHVRLGVSYVSVEEVHSAPVLSPVPWIEGPCVGIFYARGSLFPVIEPAIRPTTHLHPAPYLIRINCHGTAFGVLADSVADIVKLEIQRIAGNSSRTLRPCHFGGEILVEQDRPACRQFKIEDVVLYLHSGGTSLE